MPDGCIERLFGFRRDVNHEDVIVAVGPVDLKGEIAIVFEANVVDCGAVVLVVFEPCGAVG